jgi:hypothetical protein
MHLAKRVIDCLPKAEVFAPADEQESMLIYGKPGLDFEPTDALPGSVEKIAVLAYRAEMGLPLWHRDDKVSYDGVNEYVEKVDPWAIPDDDFGYDDEYYEIEAELPEHLK